MARFAFFAPGPFEMIILAVIVGIPILIVLVVLLLSRRSNLPPHLQDDLIQCPGCGEWIQRRAVKCRFCDTRFDGE